ncbi:MAG: hypothetical protein ABR599_03830 [Gemmatimonadota bacterium]|nr:hypothetical protein [Chloroflexota bacterium]
MAGAAWMLAALGPSSVAAQAAADSTRLAPDGRTKVIRDPRLLADSTLFPYEWPALDALSADLRRLRPALEGDSIEVLTAAIPALDSLVARVLEEPTPRALAHRGEELRGRAIALRAALDEARLWAEEAGAVPALPDDGFELIVGGGPAPGAAEESDGLEDRAPGPEEMDVAGDRGGSADSLAEGSLEAAAAHPRLAFIEAWRDTYVHAEALMHALRDPRGGPEEAEVSPPPAGAEPSPGSTGARPGTP